MRAIQLAALACCLACTTPSAKGATKGKCAETETLIPILFRFQDDPVAQASWVLESLRPTLMLERRKLFPIANDARDGELSVHFCAPASLIRDRFVLTIGPRSLTLAARPSVKGVDGATRMTEIALLDQARPNWVIVKAFERLSPANTGLPSFDVELFNFGSIHPGGRVQYEAGSHSASCMRNRPGQSVTVQVALSGKRLKIASADPEYPEELVERSANVRSGYCGGNFSITADFGATGSLPTGPTRIRYVLKSTTVPGTPKLKGRTVSGFLEDIELPDLHAAWTYFPADGYHISVVGEGIW